MKINDIKNPVSILQGAGQATIKYLSNLNIFSIGDLLQFYPRDFEDRTKRIYLNQFNLSKVHTIAKNANAIKKGDKVSVHSPKIP